MPTVPRPRLSVPEMVSEGGQQVFPGRLTKRKILFNPCLVCPIQDRSFREEPFPFAALGCEQMAPARLAAQDFPGASHFKTLGYRLFRLTSSDRFWHKEPVKYAWPSDSQGQNDRLAITIERPYMPRGTDAVTRPSPVLTSRSSSAAAVKCDRTDKTLSLAEDADCLSKEDHDDRPYNRKNHTRWMKRRSICGLGE